MITPKEIAISLKELHAKVDRFLEKLDTIERYTKPVINGVLMSEDETRVAIYNPYDQCWSCTEKRADGHIFALKLSSPTNLAKFIQGTLT